MVVPHAARAPCATGMRRPAQHCAVHRAVSEPTVVADPTAKMSTGPPAAIAAASCASGVSVVTNSSGAPQRIAQFAGPRQRSEREQDAEQDRGTRTAHVDLSGISPGDSRQGNRLPVRRRASLAAIPGGESRHSNHRQRAEQVHRNLHGSTLVRLEAKAGEKTKEDAGAEHRQRVLPEQHQRRGNA